MSLTFENLMRNEGLYNLLEYYTPERTIDIYDMSKLFKGCIYYCHEKYVSWGQDNNHHFYYFVSGSLKDKVFMVIEYEGSCELCDPWNKACNAEEIPEYYDDLVLNCSKLFSDINDILEYDIYKHYEVIPKKDNADIVYVLSKKVNEHNLKKRIAIERRHLVRCLYIHKLPYEMVYAISQNLNY